MNKDELLTKLAMELAEWPSRIFQLPTLPSGFNWGSMSGVVVMGSVLIRESDWLQRRKELINEPDDKDAPEWAEWVCQDSSGVWFFTKREPFIDNALDCFVYRGYSTDVKYGPKGCIPAGHDWRKTKRRVKKNSCTEGGSQIPANSYESRMVEGLEGCRESIKLGEISVSINIDEITLEQINSLKSRLEKASKHIEMAKAVLEGRYE